MSGITYTKAQTAPAGGIAIGDPVMGGTLNNVLFIRPDGILDQDPTFLWEFGKLTSDRFSSIDGSFEFPDGSIFSNGSSVTIYDFLLSIFSHRVFIQERLSVLEIAMSGTGGANRAGNFTLSGGSSSIVAGYIEATSIVLVTLVTPDPVNYALASVVLSPGVGFTVASSNPLDTSTYAYLVIQQY